jgi:hypothetical protein
MNDISQNIANQSPDAIACGLMQKAHNRDGLPEIAIGVFFLLIAGMMWLTVVFPPRSPIYVASILGLMLTMMVLPLRMQWVLKKVRRHFLIEKEGYVEFKPVNRKRSAILAALALVLAVAAIIAAYYGAFPPSRWILAGTGIGGGVILAFAGRLPRFNIGGVLMAATGILLAFSRASLEVGFLILYGLIGLLSLISGSMVLLLFLRQPAEPAEPAKSGE